jgi:broad specificity phosphatase PhoE
MRRDRARGSKEVTMTDVGDPGPGSRVTLLAHAPTAATALTAFPIDEPLDGRGRTWAESVRGALPRAHRARCAPARACRETCAVLDLRAEVDDGLREWDLGAWAGRTLGEVVAERPGDVETWLADPSSAPHHGEPLTDLVRRVRGWLHGAPPGHTLAVCGPAVVRAAVLAVLDAPATAFWRLDVAPLTVTDLRGGPGPWTVRATGAPLAPRPRASS